MNNSNDGFSCTKVLEQKKFSAASDCWSYGILLYEIWTKAETPYKGMNNHQVWLEVANGEFETARKLMMMMMMIKAYQ